MYLLMTKITRLTGGQKSVDEACNRVPEVAGKAVNMYIGRFRIQKDGIIKQTKQTKTQTPRTSFNGMLERKKKRK